MTRFEVWRRSAAPLLAGVVGVTLAITPADPAQSDAPSNAAPHPPSHTAAGVAGRASGAVAVVADPRPEIAAALLRGDLVAALALTERSLATDPGAGLRGMDFARGEILARLDRHREAAGAFAMAMARSPQELRRHARFRMAVAQAAMQHPEVAAGLVATLLAEQGRPGGPVPDALVPPAVRLLVESLAQGGDCRVLAGLDARAFERADRRRLDLARADCRLRAGETTAAIEGFAGLLDDEDVADAVALEAAERLAGLPAIADAPVGASDSAASLERSLGLVLHQHRDFDRAALYLEAALRRDGDHFDVRYALLRGHFWQNRLQAAAVGFGELAESLLDTARRALSLFQQGRSLELLGDAGAASAAFRRAYLAEPRGENAPAALLSALRVDAGRGLDHEATQLLDILRLDRAWRSAAARATVHLASGDLVAGRDDRAGAWLDLAARSDAPNDEVAYWRGRWLEIRGATGADPATRLRLAEAAVDAYLGGLRHAPHGAFTGAIRTRLADPALRQAAEHSPARHGLSGTKAHLEAALLLLPPGDPRTAEVRTALRAVLRADPVTAPWVDLEPAAPARWPLWSTPARQPAERLLGLLAWRDGATAILRHFPLQSPELALAGAAIAHAAGDHRRGLEIAEVLAQRVPPRLPRALWPTALRRALYPNPYGPLIDLEARKHKIDPALLAGLLREESRLDPRAFSGASARGLAQFVLPTARDLAARHGLGPIVPADLERPEVSIALAAAYLAELLARAQGSVPQAVAAYNAGETQAALWRRYCKSNEPEEYVAKVSFKETRAYVLKVLASREQYAALAAESR